MQAKICLKEYIKHIIAEQQRQNNDILQAIINKFLSDYIALASNKRDAFWKRYNNADEAFQKQMYSTYTFNKKTVFDFWLNSLELKEYLKPALRNAEMIVIEEGRVSAVSLEDVSSALEIAENVEEFIEMVRAAIA